MTTHGTFSIIPNWVIRESDLSGRELLVYIALLSHIDKYGHAFPSMKTLCREARQSEPTVRKALAELENRGLIQKRERRRENLPNLPNLYIVAVFDREAPNTAGLKSDIGVKELAAPGTKILDPSVKEVGPEEEPLEGEPLEEDAEAHAGARADDGFHFPSSLATAHQVIYLRDLWILCRNEIPDDSLVEKMRSLSGERASELIDEYLAAIGRGLEYEGPVSGPEYEALSPKGQEYADNAMLPPSGRVKL